MHKTFGCSVISHPHCLPYCAYLIVFNSLHNIYCHFKWHYLHPVSVKIKPDDNSYKMKPVSQIVSSFWIVKSQITPPFVFIRLWWLLNQNKDIISTWASLKSVLTHCETTTLILLLTQITINKENILH